MLKAGSTIGILGGGQLGRMLSVAASRLGYKTHIYEPGANPPAADVAHACTQASYDDQAALQAFAARSGAPVQPPSRSPWPVGSPATVPAPW